MIKSTDRSSVTKKSLQLVTIMCLINLPQGRFINNPADIQSRGWYRNQARNSEVRDPRLSEHEWSTYSVREPNGPGTFAFGYDNAVDSAGNEHYRSEEKLNNGTVIGEYGYTDNAIKRMVRVSYIADHRGYRAQTKILPMEDVMSRNVISSAKN